MRLFGCDHKWIVRQVNQGAGWDRFTRVLYVCDRCGKPRHKTIKGWWRLDDLVIASDDDLADFLTQPTRGGKQ